jgi:hypothetical protein
MERVLGIRQCISNLHWLSLQRQPPQNATPAGLQNKLANNFALTSGNAVCRKGSPDNLDRGVVWVVRDGVGLARTLKRTIQMRRSARTKTDITAMTQSRKKMESCDVLHHRRLFSDLATTIADESKT